MNDAGNNYLKERNLKILKRILFEKKTATKTELSNISTLSTVTVNSLVKVLVETGEFIEGELIQQKMGRPAVIYSFNYNFQKYLLLSIQEEKNKLYINTVITNMAGEITDRKLYSFENIEMQAIIEIIDEAVKGNNSIAAIGISIPGQTKDEKIFVSWNEKLNGWNLKKEISSKYDIPVKVENDANLVTVGYCIKNNIYSRESVVGIYFPKDSLPGASIFWDGKIFTGKDGLAGEIKYLPDFINYRKITSADSVIEKLINTIVLFNSITAPGLFIIYAENINEDEFQKRVYDNEIIKRQPNVPVIKVADTFGEDIITGLQWLVASDIDVQESAD
ncbi:ROK family protein [Sebaldella termitidis]|uniref:ROK family protein n=1 Tax=Sebaldella termitidis TaxID=826 RepID=UPI003EBD88AA